MSSSSLRAIVLSLAVLATAAPARAQDAAPAPSPAPAPPKPRKLRLEYSTAPGCLDEESFHHAVAVLMEDGADPFDPDAPDGLRVTFKKIPGGYRGSVQKMPAKRDPWPVEETIGATCSQVFRSAARVASMRAAPVAAAALPAPAPPPDPPPEPSAPPEPSPPPPDPVTSPPLRVAPAPFAELRFTPPPTPRDPMDLTVALHTAFILTAGFTDNAGPALQIGASARYDRDTWGISLGLEFRGVFPGGVVAREVIDLKPGETPISPVPFDVSQLGLQLVPCVHFAEYFAGCGVVQGFAILLQDHLGLEPLLGWGLGPRFAVEVPFAERFAVFGFAEALFPVLRPGQPYGNAAQPDRGAVVWDQSIVSGFFGAGVSVKFK